MIGNTVKQSYKCITNTCRYYTEQLWSAAATLTNSSDSVVR